jgi:hypothetical protein
MAEAILQQYNNTTLKKITNIYQLNYTNSAAPGIGDYIRGCFTLLQIINSINLCCGKNLKFEMDLRNHPISKYIVINNKDDTIKYDELKIYHNINLVKTNLDTIHKNSVQFLTDFVDFANKMPPSIEHFHTFCCSYEIFDKFTTYEKDIIKSNLIPNYEMKAYIDEAMDTLKISKKNYSVIHIRCPDEVSFPVLDLNTEYLKKLDEEVQKNTVSNKPYLLLTNNNKIKTYLKKNQNLTMMFNEICHIGVGSTQSDQSVKDTLLDFYLLAYSNEITAFSHYIHGTGFSQECSKLYDVPFKLIKLPL